MRISSGPFVPASVTLRDYTRAGPVEEVGVEQQGHASLLPTLRCYHSTIHSFSLPPRPNPMATLQEQIRTDLNASRKNREKLRTLVLTTLIAEIRNREIELGAEASDDEVQRLLGTAIKRRREAAEQMRQGGREELAQREDEEAEILRASLPPQLGEAEVRAWVREAITSGASDLGSVMKAVMPKVKGRFEGKELNRVVREELGPHPTR